MFATLIAALAILPATDAASESVDLIELNHFYDEHGRIVFDQVISYDWAPSHTRYNVRAWRLVKHPSQLPQRDWGGRGYSATWIDGELARRVTAAAIRETWTQHDPELLEREYLPKERRRELTTPRRPQPQGTP